MTGILLVHGGWHGEWCWEQFADRLADRGHDVRAVALRGHDQHTGRIWHRIHDYADDVGRAAAGFTEPPVLVGHSLGGLLVQIHLEHRPAAGGVLMASIPPGGTIAAVARIALRHPILLAKANLLMSLRPLISSPELVREWFFTPDTAPEVVAACARRLQDESYPAFLDTLLEPRHRRSARVPVLVLGAGRDAFFTPVEIHRTARAYATDAEIFPSMGHDMMLDTGWRAVADHVHTWIGKTVDNQLADRSRCPSTEPPTRETT